MLANWLQSKRNLPIRYLWLSLPLAVSFVALNLTPLKEGDLWWHLKIGQQILTDWKIPQVDIFTFTAYGQPYISHSWLSDALFFGAEKLGGLAALVLMQSIIGVLTVLIMLRESLRRGAPPALAGSLTLLGGIGLLPFASARPQIFSFFLMAALYAVLSNYCNGQKGRLGWMPVAILLWVNLHGGWTIGLMLIGIEICCTVVLKFRGQRSIALKPLILWGLAAGAATLLNPKGTKLYTHIVTALSNPINKEFVSEWQPLKITDIYSWPFFGLLALWIVGLAFQQRSSRFRDVVTMFFLAAMSLRYCRMEPYFLVVAVPIAASTLARIDWRGFASRFSCQNSNDGADIRALAGYFNWLILVMICVVALFSLHQVMQKDGTNLIGPDFPVQSVSVLAQQAPPQSNILNLAEWGGYLLWKLYPDMRVFADGRVELLSSKIWNDYVTLTAGGPAWAELLEQYRVDYLVLNKDRQAGLILKAYKKGWNCLSEDDVAIILSRRQSAGTCPSLKDIPR